MEDGPKIKINPLKIFTFSLAFSFIIGEASNIYLSLNIIINLVGLFLLFFFFIIFFISARMFFTYNEKLQPQTSTNKIIKTGIYSYTRNPIYLSFVGFQMSMFLSFGNIFYFVSSISLFFWIHFMVILREEKYLEKKFQDQYVRYCANVPRWIIY